MLKTAFQFTSPSGSNARLSILIFHRVLSDPDPLFPGELDTLCFEQVMCWLKEWFNVLPLDEAIVRLYAGDLPQRSAAITFDDGYADNLTNALPVLKKHGLSATFFIATGFLDGGWMWNDIVIQSVRSSMLGELDASSLGFGIIPISNIHEKRQALAQLIPAIKHLPGNQRNEAVDAIRNHAAGNLPAPLMLSSNQVRKIRDEGMLIGAHTVNHPILAKLDTHSARKEIAASREQLSQLLGEAVGLFAYPNGKHGQDYLPDHAEIVRSLGFDAALSTNWGVATRNSSPFQLPRFTPWDTVRWRFGLRLLNNLRKGDPFHFDGRSAVAHMHQDHPPRLAQVCTPMTAQPSVTLPRISVVVPCYNASKWISATLDSVMSQEWPDLEIIVVDDGSSDDSSQIVRSSFPGVCLVQQSNKGIAAARNQGISVATGNWIAFVDADDIWLPNKLRLQWNLLQSAPGTRMVYSGWHVWSCTDPYPDQALLADLSHPRAGMEGREGPSGWIYPELLADCHVWTSTVLVHRSLLSQIGTFDESLRIGEDYDLWLRASRYTPITRVPLPLALYRMHPHSITKAAHSKNYQAIVIMKALRTWGMNSPDGRTANKSDVAAALARTWRDFAAAHLKVRNYRRAVQGAFMALRYDWLKPRNWKLLARTALAPIIGRGETK